MSVEETALFGTIYNERETYSSHISEKYYRLSRLQTFEIRGTIVGMKASFKKIEEVEGRNNIVLEYGKTGVEYTRNALKIDDEFIQIEVCYNIQGTFHGFRIPQNGQW